MSDIIIIYHIILHYIVPEKWNLTKGLWNNVTTKRLGAQHNRVEDVTRRLLVWARTHTRIFLHEPRRRRQRFTYYYNIFLLRKKKILLLFCKYIIML